MKRKIGLIIVSVLFSALTLFGCNQSDMALDISDDEILLQIQLDIQENIGLLVVNYDAEGFSGSGGTSNADKSLLKHDELIYYTLEKEHYEVSSHVENLSLQFTIITDYFTPNYDNIYPAEETKPLDAIYLDVNFGETYFITITGDKKNGYTAVLNK